MARYISTQYPNKNSDHQRKGKKGDLNEKKGDDPKFEDKDNITTGTAHWYRAKALTSEYSLIMRINS